MQSFHQIVPPSVGISCHAWNHTGEMLALCPGSNELYIYENCHHSDPNKWIKAHVLKEHDMLISGISWSDRNNKIVTCSHDRNAFVWKYDSSTNQWVPTLCVLRIDRAATYVQWSPDGAKFAVGSSNKTIPVCYLDSSQSSDWYVSRIIKRHKSTVVKLAWHPNSQILATVSSDRRCRIISATMNEIDRNADSGPFASHVPFGEVYPNGEILCNSWANAVDWNSSGSLLAVASHDSTIQIVDCTSNCQILHTIMYNSLPLNEIRFVGEEGIVGVGHDMEPLLFSSAGSGKWAMKSKIDSESLNSPAKRGSANSVTKVASARAMFQAKTSRGEDSANATQSSFKTTHRNVITHLQVRPNNSSYQISTTGPDGLIVFWEIGSLGLNVGSMSIR